MAAGEAGAGLDSKMKLTLMQLIHNRQKNKNAEIKERKRFVDGQTNPQMGRLFPHLRSGDQF